MGDYTTIRVDYEYSRHRAESFRRFQHERKFWDCKVNVGTETLLCHSVIISALSPVIEEMIQANVREGKEKQITFDDIQPEVMRKITNYMYTGSVDIPRELVLEVVQVCEELKIEDLKERCLYRVPDILSPQVAMGWMRYAHENKLLSILDSCKRYVSDSFLEVTKEKVFIKLTLDELKTTLLELSNAVPPDHLLTSVLSWIKYDKESRKLALDYTLGYLKLKECTTQFLNESTKEHIEIFRCNPEFNHKVTHILHSRRLRIVVIGGLCIGGNAKVSNVKSWKLLSETQFVDITETLNDLIIRGQSICLYDWNKLVLIGGIDTNVCAIFDMSTNKWKKIQRLKYHCQRSASLCILQQIYVFGGDLPIEEGKSRKWLNRVAFLNIEQKHAKWQSAPAMPSPLKYPKVTNNKNTCLSDGR